PMIAEQRIRIRDKEVRIFEITEEANVECQRQTERPSGRGTLFQFAQPRACGVVENERRQQERKIEPTPPSVEIERGEDKPSENGVPAQRASDDHIDQQREREE